MTGMKSGEADRRSHAQNRAQTSSFWVITVIETNAMPLDLSSWTAELVFYAKVTKCPKWCFLIIFLRLTVMDVKSSSLLAFKGRLTVHNVLHFSEIKTQAPYKRMCCHSLKV